MVLEPLALEPNRVNRVISISRRSSGMIAMVAALGLGLLRVVLCQAPSAADSSQSPPAVAAPAAAPAAAAPAHATPGESRSWDFKTRASIRTIACSEDGKLIAVANGSPTLIKPESGASRVKDNWKPSAEILDARTGKTVAVLKLTTADEDAVLAATDASPVSK